MNGIMAIDLVIDAPDLQSPTQRLNTAVLLGMGWLSWAYFSFPFVELCGWFLNIHICSVWVDLSGGYASLRHLLGIYALTIVGWLAVWGLWSLYRDARLARRSRETTASAPLVDLATLCEDFGVEPERVAQCRTSHVTTVHFDGDGRIIGMEAL